MAVEDYVLAYARKIYGAQILYRNRMVYMKTKDDVYHIDLRMADKNVYRFHSTTKPLVLTETCLARGFFRLAAHADYKKAQKIPSNADWENFLNDAYKHIILLEEENGQN